MSNITLAKHPPPPGYGPVLPEPCRPINFTLLVLDVACPCEWLIRIGRLHLGPSLDDDEK